MYFCTLSNLSICINMSEEIEKNTVSALENNNSQLTERDNFHIERMKEKKSLKLKKFRKWSFIIIGVFAVLFGVISNRYVEMDIYGGDAFTGIQNTIAQTAAAVNRILVFAGLILIVVGATNETKGKYND